MDVFENRVRQYLAHVVSRAEYQGFDVRPLSRVKFISLSPTQSCTKFEFIVDENMSNLDGNLHGGAATTIFDNLTSTALFTLDGISSWDALGVTRSLTVTFLRPLPLGASVELSCEVVAKGKKMALLKGTMRTVQGKLCAVCVHDKFMPDLAKL